MKLFIQSVVLTSLAAGVLACGSSDNQYNSVSNFGGPNQCLPNGYTSNEDKGQTTQAALTSSCQARCGALGTACQFWFGQLQCAPNGLCTGQCFYYPSVPAGPATCANYPTVVIGQAKDNTNKCFTSSTAIATPYCSSYLSLGTVTSYTSTSTPVAYSTTTVATVTVSVCPPPPSKRKRSEQKRHVLEAEAAGALAKRAAEAQITAAPALDLAKRAAAATPACLNTNSIPASRISSACKCLSVPSTTLYTLSTAPTSTSTVSVTSTSTYTSATYTSFHINAQVTGSTLAVSAQSNVIGEFPLNIRYKGNPVSGDQFWKQGNELYQLDRGQYVKGVSIYGGGFSLQGVVSLTDTDDGPSEDMTCSIAFSTDGKITCSTTARGQVTFAIYPDTELNGDTYQYIGVHPEATGATMTLYAVNVVPGCYP